MSDAIETQNSNLFATVSFGGGGKKSGGGRKHGGRKNGSVRRKPVTCVGSNYGAVSRRVCVDNKGGSTDTTCVGITTGPVTISQCETTTHGPTNQWARPPGWKQGNIAYPSGPQ